MPVGRTPNLDKPDQKNVIIQNATLVESVGGSAGAAVAVVDNAGTPEYKLCSCSMYASRFFGFLKDATSNGGKPVIIAGRGSTVTPIVEGGGNLTVGQEVFLSETMGEVTQTAPYGVSNRIVKIGVAISATQMILVPEMQIQGA